MSLFPLKYTPLLLLLLGDFYSHAFSVTSDTSGGGGNKITTNNLKDQNNKNYYHDNENSSVQVVVKRDYPSLSSAKEARDAWLSYVWSDGGGLAAWVIPKDNDKQNGVDGGSSAARDTKKLPFSFPSRRLLLPIFMEEELISSNDYDYSCEDETNEEEIVLKYIVTDAGLLSSEIAPNSHLGTVTFTPTLHSELEKGIGITMMWDVTFDVITSSRRSFWEAFTNKMITDASNNLSAYVATPILYTRRTRLANVDLNLTPKQTMEAWVNFCWKGGGGLLLPPPLCFDQEQGGSNGSGNVRWIIPPFLKERILSTTCRTQEEGEEESDDKSTVCEILYTVDNPSIFTYQVHSHLGRVRFYNSKESSSSSSAAGALDMIWEIEIRPYHGYGWSTFVKMFTSAIVSTYARNFACHLSEGNATVSLKPPRGKFGGKTIMKIRKDSWIGSVFYAHLNDNRSVLEQTISMLQPWTWGRSSDDGCEGEVWSEGRLE